jgi:RNA polymerase sigma-70 factor (ECF subfamily)
MLFVAHYAWVWRTLRRLGVPESAVDDAAQQVFLVADGQLDRVSAGRERAYLTGVALRVAANLRRAASRCRESPDEGVGDAAADLRDPEQLLDQKQRRELLDRWLDGLPLELRAPFVLFELEGLELSEIAESLEVPLGTVKTRLRRARQLFLGRATSEGGHP